MEFTKVHGLGNDFVLIDCHQQEIHNPHELAIKVCHRRFGVGADGLVLILPSKIADFTMRIYNSDGSEAEMCGNAIRCFARYVYERGLTNKTKIQVETLAGIIIPEIVDLSKFLIKVDMGSPRLEPDAIPVADSYENKVVDKPLEVGGKCYRITAVSMGNPHCVLFVSRVDDAPVTILGPQIETHPFFPKKTNVEFIEIINPAEIKMRVWERGAAETMACGTGACASVVAAVLNGHTGRTVTVHLPGGDLLIEWAEDDHIYMTGPATEVFTGKLNLEVFEC